MLYYTALFGIGLGITNLAIFGMEQRKRKLELDGVHKRILETKKKRQSGKDIENKNHGSDISETDTNESGELK